MDEFASDLDMVNFMKNGSDYNNVASIMKELSTKIYGSRTTLSQAMQWCESFLSVKAMIKPDATVEDIKQGCQQFTAQPWVNEFTKDLCNCTTSSTTKLDFDKAYASLVACYDNAFLKSFAIQMVATSLHSLFQSVRTWRIINSFIIPSHEKLIKRTTEKLEECARTCNSMVNNEILDQEQIKRLERVEELLRDIRDAIQLITDDVKNKIAEAKRLRSNSYISCLLNGVSTFFSGLAFNTVANTIGENSFSGIATNFSTVVDAGCTIGDLIHAKKATLLIDQLQQQLNAAEELTFEQERLTKLREHLLAKSMQV